MTAGQTGGIVRAATSTTMAASRGSTPCLSGARRWRSDATVAEELEALNAGFDPDVDDNHVFEVLAQRCPPQPLVA